METSKQILKTANIVPKLQLGVKTEKGVVSTGPHKVKLIKDKEVKGTDQNGKDVAMVRYLLEVNGESRIYDCKKLDVKGDIHYLVQKLSTYNEGSEVILEMKKRGMKNYVDVKPAGESGSVEVDDDYLDIPIINENEQTDNEPTQ